MMNQKISPRTTIHVVGGGLAGSEAAYFLAQQGISVILHEMRPKKTTAAHQTGSFAELVCSNSFKSNAEHSAPGILKAEMTELGSLILKTASLHKVPAGEALAVEREGFSKEITSILQAHPNIKIVHEEFLFPKAYSKDQPEIYLLATGPLTSEPLTKWIQEQTDGDDFYFYDAIAPIVDASTIDMDSAFIANRYDKGEEVAYINCPLTQDEYQIFIEALMSSETVPSKNFEKEIFFQGCQPIEAIAATGKDTLRYGPMKPTGLENPKTGRRPYAVVQLRPENRAKTAYNIVGFQTKLKYGAQQKVLKLIPALKHAEFLRMGSIHRNSYICAPRVLRQDLSMKHYPQLYFAGQITGVEGYLESSACGLLAALFITQRVLGLPHSAPPANTALGSLLSHLTVTDPKRYQPNNIQFALFDPNLYENTEGLKRDELRAQLAQQSIINLKSWIKTQPKIFTKAF